MGGSVQTALFSPCQHEYWASLMVADVVRRAVFCDPPGGESPGRLL